jgi:hypothetical protein
MWRAVRSCAPAPSDAVAQAKDQRATPDIDGIVDAALSKGVAQADLAKYGIDSPAKLTKQALHAGQPDSLKQLVRGQLAKAGLSKHDLTKTSGLSEDHGVGPILSAAVDLAGGVSG